MSILIGGPHLYTDQVPAEPKRLGRDDHQAGLEPDPYRHSQMWSREQRAAYYAGHIASTIARAKDKRTAASPPPRPITVEPWEIAS